MTVIALSPAQAGDAASVLCDAFYDYPVMRYVLGPSGTDYDQRLRTLIGFFVGARFFRKEPVLGVHDESGGMAAVALVSLPTDPAAPEPMLARREHVWQELGSAEHQRYEAFSQACDRFAIEAPHHYLNMIGVRRGFVGRGLARQLLEAVHELSRADPDSTGVALSTENARNLSLYDHFGYRVVGHARVDDTLETWTLFRPGAA